MGQDRLVNTDKIQLKQIVIKTNLVSARLRGNPSTESRGALAQRPNPSFAGILDIFSRMGRGK